MATWTEILVGPRWAGLPGFLKDQCWALGLTPEIDVDKGFIRETVRVRVTGDDRAVEQLKTAVYASLDAYNK